MASHFRTYSITTGIFLATLFILLVSGCARQHTIESNGSSLIFHYRDAEAQEISLATSQDNFIYHTAQKEKNDLWVVHLPPWNNFSYFYIVDGQVKLPECTNTVLDDFGGKNCFYTHAM